MDNSHDDYAAKLVKQGGVDTRIFTLCYKKALGYLADPRVDLCSREVSTK